MIWLERKFDLWAQTRGYNVVKDDNGIYEDAATRLACDAFTGGVGVTMAMLEPQAEALGILGEAFGKISETLNKIDFDADPGAPDTYNVNEMLKRIRDR